MVKHAVKLISLTLEPHHGALFLFDTTTGMRASPPHSCASAAYELLPGAMAAAKTTNVERSAIPWVWCRHNTTLLRKANTQFCGTGNFAGAVWRVCRIERMRSFEHCHSAGPG